MQTMPDSSLPEREGLANAFLDLIRLISRLRGPGGCPWDAKQTEQSVKIYVLEEAYEVLDAIERGSPEDLCGELGDLLFQILFLGEMAEEKKRFSLSQIFEGITRKMIHRHPHVFGSATVRSAEEVAENWDKLKKQEKGVAESSSRLLAEVPAGLPALLRAHRLKERARRVQSAQEEGEGILEKVEEVLGTLSRHVEEKNKEGIGDDIGKALFHLADLARHWGWNAESLLRKANDLFVESFERGDEPDVTI